MAKKPQTKIDQLSAILKDEIKQLHVEVRGHVKEKSYRAADTLQITIEAFEQVQEWITGLNSFESDASDED